MESSFVRIEQKDGYKTKVYSYLTKREPVEGSVLILHGMAEHHARYEEFAHFLNKEGFDVYTYDHRGHGTDRKLTELGFFAKKNGASLVVDDAVEVLRYVEKVKRSNDFALLGHSMGSIISRNALQKFDSMNCVAICGTTMPDSVTVAAGGFVTSLSCLLHGPKHVSKKLDQLLFGNKLYTSLCTRTSVDWLTRNNTAVGAYINDPYCGFTCTTSFYRDLVRLTKLAGKKKNIARTRKDLPICFFSGDKDPVGGYGREVRKLYDTYKKLGFESLDIKLYPDCRHEILNELNSDEVMQDIALFLHKYLKS
ncbi:MAG: alpha/beta fold hydrolase [Lachnospiraceae bacterium]